MPSYDLDLSKTNPLPPGASNYVVPGSIGNTGMRSNDIEIGYAHVLTGPGTHYYAAALRELGLAVREPRDVLQMGVEDLEVVVSRADAAEAARVEAIRSARAERLAHMTKEADACAKARRAFAKNVVPRKLALAAALRAEHGADEDLADFLDAVDAAAEQTMPGSSSERFYNTERDAAERESAAPIPAEDFEVLRLQGLPRGYVPDALGLVRAVLDDRRKERAAKVARLRADLQLAGVM